MKNLTIRVLVGRLPVILSISSFAMAMQATLVQAQSFPPVVDTAVQPLPVNQVKAPPRPPGSANAVLNVGLDPLEVQRQERAHRHSKLEKKDHTRDDTRDDSPDDKRSTPKTK